jgi:hypothetical protein
MGPVEKFLSIGTLKSMSFLLYKGEITKCGALANQTQNLDYRRATMTNKDFFIHLSSI